MLYRKITHIDRIEVGDKLKQDASGKVINNKAGLVARRYVDKYGIDFEKLFAPLTRLATLSPLVALATKNQRQVHHLDINSVFLNGKLQEEVYVVQRTTRNSHLHSSYETTVENIPVV